MKIIINNSSKHHYLTMSVPRAQTDLKLSTFKFSYMCMGYGFTMAGCPLPTKATLSPSS